ncbi:MAG: Gfo/Idh/MocA family oxidoreductase [Phycisphaerales bacterium]|nr:MAG: Gfo/Idh/MocA family oxidoreductase [Phycisphaerales bacterium]
MIRIGIAGCGFMGRTCYAILAERPGVRIVALLDSEPARRLGDWSQQIGNLPSRWPENAGGKGIRAMASIDEMVSADDIDLVVITLPTYLHAPAAVAALEHGKHVLCEKPMALTADDCLRVCAAAAESPGLYMTGQCIRFWPQYVEIKRRVESGEYGPIRSVVLRRIASPPGYSQDNWLMDHRLSGGALIDLHVHDVDFAHVLMGPPRAITASGTTGPSGGVDHVCALWDYGDGLIVSLEGGWSYHAGFPFEMFVNVRCERATLQWRMSDGPAVKMFADAAEPQELAVKDSNGWAEEIAYFLECVRRGRQPELCMPESSALSIRLAELERESIQCGRRVNCDA